MLVNICLDCQSRASLAAATRLAPGPLLVELPANCTAGRPWGGAGDRLAATRGCEGRWAGPGTTPLRQQACPPGPSSGPHWGRGGESHHEVSLDSEQAAFPRGAPQIYIFLILEESKIRDKTLGVLLVNHSPPSPTAWDGVGRHALCCPYQQLPTTEPTLGPWAPAGAVETWGGVPSLGQQSRVAGV